MGKNGIFLIHGLSTAMVDLEINYGAGEIDKLKSQKEELLKDWEAIEDYTTQDAVMLQERNVGVYKNVAKMEGAKANLIELKTQLNIIKSSDNG